MVSMSQWIQDAQKSLSARLQRAKPLSDARTLLEDFFSILLEAQPDAKQDILRTKIQRELLPMVIGREVFVLTE